MSTRIAEAFTVLRPQGLPASGLRVHPASEGIDVALDPLGNRHVLFATGEDDVDVQDRSSAAVWLRRLVLQDERYLSLECREAELADLFIRLADEIADRVEDVDLEERRQVIRAELERWRGLFARAGSDRLGAEAEAGLYGELVVLRQFARHEPSKALEAWVGPLDGQHDFRWADQSIEVKTTRAKEGFTVTVHGLKQLDLPESEATLRLAGIRLVADPAGKSLPEVVDELLAVVDAPVLLERLREVGYSHSGARADWSSYIVDTAAYWHVTGDTPGLRSSALPVGWETAISNVRYSLDLAALGDPMDPDQVESLWGRT